MADLALREFRFLGVTQSLCPDCLAVVPAKIVAREGRVYFRKFCPSHGERIDFVCSDERWFDRMEYSLPGRVPARFAIEPRRGCPYDCGLCTEHEQHTCVAVLEITDNCNLRCPMCYASSGPGGRHRSREQCRLAISHLVRYEGRPEILQLSGGEPTMHPEFVAILDDACRQPIDIVMINSNGIRLANDARLRDELAARRHRLEVYLQFDGFDEATQLQLRGESLTETKLRAVDLLGEAGIRTTLVCTVEQQLNLRQLGQIVRFASERPWVTGVSFQPATYVGRAVEPESLDNRVTFPDVIRAVADQCQGVWQDSDFLPLPCAHPNAHSLAYGYRLNGRVVPLTRFIDIAQHLDLLANGISFNRASAERLIRQLLARTPCGCSGDCGTVGLTSLENSMGAQDRIGVPNDLTEVASSFFQRALAQELSPADVFRITTTSFMDAYNFDIRQLMKSCVHHILSSGHLIPFCAYNVLYRDGHLPLPSLAASADSLATLTVEGSL